MLESAELVKAFFCYVSWAAPFKGFLGMSHWGETLGQAQNPLEILYIISGLEIPVQDKCSWGEGRVGLPSRPNQR